MSFSRSTKHTSIATDRRQFLAQSALGFGALAASSLLPAATLANPLSAKKPHFEAKGKAVIFLFMHGGPSHIDTFDPKPALVKYAGQQPTGELYKKSKGTGFMPSPLRFDKAGKSGLEVSETLPHLPKLIDIAFLTRLLDTDV